MLNGEENPFASVGNTVEGDYFIGRERGREAIESRVVRSKSQRGSLAIIGLPRMGKNCLVNKVLMEPEMELHQKGLVPINMDLIKYAHPDDFFKSLVSHCRDKLEELGYASQQILDAASKVGKEGLQWGDSREEIERFFKRVRRLDVWIVVILQNFDYARFLFSNYNDRIQEFRELTKPEYRVSWIVLATRPIMEIETQSNMLSDGMFTEHHLKMFEERDMGDYFGFLVQAGVNLTNQHKEIIKFYCGGHPYLLTLVGYQLVEKYGNQSGLVDVTQAFDEVEQKFSIYYGKITDLLSDDTKLQKLRQILFGPVYGIESRDIKNLLNYGLIQLNPRWSAEPKQEEPAYVAFSQHFQNHLRNMSSEFEFHSRLEQTGQALHEIINTTLVIDEEQDTRDTISYAALRDMFATIFANWDTFRLAFSKQRYKDEQYWHAAAELLMKMCQPLMQPQIDELMQSSYVNAQRYCQEILDIFRMLEDEKLAIGQKSALSSDGGETVLPGKLLWGDQYKVLRSLGHSNHSQVVQIQDQLTELHFAAKLIYLSPHLQEDITQLQEMLVREATILLRLAHENIGRVFAVRKEPFGIIMQFIEGQSLRQSWKGRSRPTPERVIGMGMKLANALKYAHYNGVIHRDIKPENIIIDKKNNEPILIDFDIARGSTVETILTSRKDGFIGFVGTLGYCPPEQLEYPKSVKSSADIFALGVVLYEALTGGLPYQRDERSERYRKNCQHPPLRRSIPEPLYRVLCHMLHQDSLQRPDAEQAYIDMQNCLPKLSHKCS